MRLVYLHQYFATPECATGTRSYEFGAALVERGHDVTVISGTSMLEPWLGPEVHRRPQELEKDGIRLLLVPDGYEQSRSKVRRLRGFGRFVAGAVRAGRRLARPDVVFATSPPLPIALSGIALSRLHRSPFVLEIRDLWPASLVEFGGISPRHPGIVAAGGLERLAYGAANRIVATTPGARRDLVRRGWDGDRIDVVELGADPHLFQPGCSDGSFRSAHGLEDRFVALFPGAHGIANGLDIVVDAASVLQERGSRVTIVFVGRGQLKPQLQDQARRLGLRNVLFLDPVPKVELTRVLDEVDVGLAVLKPCGILDKILSNKLFDFMAAGRPVVANLPGDMAAILEGQGCGRVVQPYTPERLADTLDELAAAPPEELEAMGARARRLAETRYSRANLVDAFEAALQAAAGQT